MKKPQHSHCQNLTLLVLLLRLPTLLPLAAADGVAITQADYEGLLAFKHALLDPGGYLRGWNGTGLDACSGSWAGIKCVKGQVIAIQLPWHGLAGVISDKLGQLTALRKLNLHDNALQGHIPSTIAFLPQLRGIYLFNNRLSGAIPSSIANSPLLQTLDLSNNLLTGSIPSSLSNLSSLYRLNLSYNSLSGSIPTFPSTLPLLHTIDLSHNSISGTLPETLFHISSLVHLDLQGNQIQGTVPNSNNGLKHLSFLSLKQNQIRGEIPSTLGNFVNLSELDLSNNHLSGEIPASLAELPHLSSFNVSGNNLSGPVPILLAERFNSSSFSGNLALCGYSKTVPCLSPHRPPPPAPPSSHPPSNIAPIFTSTSTRPRKLSIGNIIVLVVVASAAFLFVLFCLLLAWFLARKKGVLRRKSGGGSGVDARQKSVGSVEAESGGDAGGKLVHFDGPIMFTADDLLCATAEIMGKTSFGTVYKATLEDGNQVAVKRLREKITKNQKEFEAEVVVLGKMRHPNLLPLRAYYLGPKGEKLLVFDYMHKGSLAAFLHARGPDTAVDLPTRMKIAAGVARGLLHLHVHEDVVHGAMTSANIFLDDDCSPKISEYGLSCLTTAGAGAAAATAGSLRYRAPELVKQKKPSAKADVYSLGVLMLELLTGKSPAEEVNGMELPQWVASVAEEQWTTEVFDLELVREGGAQEEMLSALKLAMRCVNPSPAARPEIDHVLRQLQELRPEFKGGVGSTSG